MAVAAHAGWSQGNPGTPRPPSRCTDEGMVQTSVCVSTQDLIPRRLSLHITLPPPVTVGGFIFPKGPRGSGKAPPSLRNPKTTFSEFKPGESLPNVASLPWASKPSSGAWVSTPLQLHLTTPRCGEPWSHIQTPRARGGGGQISRSPILSRVSLASGPESWRKGKPSPHWAPCPGTSEDEVSPQLRETGGPWAQSA